MLDRKRRWVLGLVVVMATVMIGEISGAAQAPTVKGKFVVGGADAGLKHVRAQRVEKHSFAVAGDRLKARFATRGEQTFGEDRYTVDLDIDAPLEK